MRPQMTNLRYACNGNSAASSRPIFVLYPTTNPTIFQQTFMISLLMKISPRLFCLNSCQ